MGLDNILNVIAQWIKTEGVKLLFSLVVLFLSFKTINILINKLEKKVRKSKRSLDRTITSVLFRVLKTSLKILVFISFLEYVGVETTSIAAAITSAGLGIGLALQGSLSNFAGGVIILVMRPYKLGDYIECNGFSGTVEEIKMFYTYVVTIDNKVIMMPNGKIADSSIINYSTKKLRRLDMFFNIEYGSDMSVVKTAILTGVKKSAMYKENIEPFINIEEYKESYIKVVLKVWCDNDRYWTLYYFLQEEVKKQFEKYKIEVPYNKINLL